MFMILARYKKKLIVYNAKKILVYNKKIFFMSFIYLKNK